MNVALPESSQYAPTPQSSPPRLSSINTTLSSSQILNARNPPRKKRAGKNRVPQAIEGVCSFISQNARRFRNADERKETVLAGEGELGLPIPITFTDIVSEQQTFTAAEGEIQQSSEDRLARLELETHASRVAAKANHAANKSTNVIYSKHLTEYEGWFFKPENYDGKISPYPILPSKVAAFLETLQTREKKTPGGGTLGLSSLQQYLNAIEDRRKEVAHLYPTIPNVILRTDIRIKSIETIWKKDKSKRAETGNTLKAAGAHRGDNTRELSWSDLVYHVHKLPLAKKSIPTLILLANNGKTNREGRLDQVGIWRHEDPALCGIFAVALHIFFSDEVLRMDRPSFEPDFETDDPKIGPYGFRGWYYRTLFPGRMKSGSNEADVSLYRPMTYQTHNNAVKGAFEATGIRLSHTTPAGRTSAARNASMYNATEQDTKAHGLWRDGSSFRQCYMRELPISAMAALAGFDGQQVDKYWIARADIEPPPELAASIFPWLEQERKSYEARAEGDSHAVDFALDGFLKVLTWFRSVLLQDLAILRERYPSAPIFSLAPFNTPGFDIYANALTAAVSAAKDAHAQGFPELPRSISDALGNAVGQIIGKMNDNFAKMTTLQLQLREEQQDTTDAVLGLSGRTVQKRAREGAASLETITQQLAQMMSAFQQLSGGNFSPSLPLYDRQPQQHTISRVPVHSPHQPRQPYTRPPTTSSQSLVSSRGHSSQFQDPSQVQHGYPSSPNPPRFSPSTTPFSSPPRPSQHSTSPHTSPQLPVPPLSYGTRPPTFSPRPDFDSRYPPPSDANLPQTVQQPSINFHSQSLSPYRHPNTSKNPTLLHHQPSSSQPPPFGIVRPLPVFPTHGRPRTILQPTMYQPAPDNRESEMRSLYEKYRERIESMDFIWLPQTGSRAALWVPLYFIPSMGTLRQVWTEWDKGKQGCLSVREIEEIWKTAWRPRTGHKLESEVVAMGTTTSTHFFWMKKLDSLVQEIVGGTQLRESRVIDFLEAKVESNARKLISSLKDNAKGAETRRDISEAARRWSGVC
ncbi:hypothetical protein JCM5350_005476 [Sporobolomyces pararoseus]